MVMTMVGEEEEKGKDEDEVGENWKLIFRVNEKSWRREERN